MKQRWGKLGRERNAAISNMSLGARDKGSKLRCFGKGSENLQHLFCMAISYDYTVRYAPPRPALAVLMRKRACGKHARG